MHLRSGVSFGPYGLKLTLQPRAAPENPISTPVDVEPLLQEAAALEDLRYEQGEDDSEGLGITSRPSSPLTEVESEGEADSEVLAQPQPGIGTPSGSKKRRNEGASRRRAKKRAALASSGHKPHIYAANPSVTKHHAEELKPLLVSKDAKNFPASGSGSWVGLRKKGAMKRGSTVSELAERSFAFVEWDGM